MKTMEDRHGTSYSILVFLSPGEVFSLGRTCKSMRFVVGTSFYWETLGLARRAQVKPFYPPPSMKVATTMKRFRARIQKNIFFFAKQERKFRVVDEEGVYKAWLRGDRAKSKHGHLFTDGLTVTIFDVTVGLTNRGDKFINNYTAASGNFISKTISNHVGKAKAISGRRATLILPLVKLPRYVRPPVVMRSLGLLRAVGKRRLGGGPAVWDPMW